MFPSNPSDASGAIGGLAIFGLVMVLFWRLIVWVREAPVRPDPWDQEIAEKVADPEIVQTESPGEISEGGKTGKRTEKSAITGV